jgi:SpoVK/Ycf46/Vps4 family AAA+-type ATPase
MNLKSHFFDIDVLIKLNNQAWVIDKNNPNIPIMKISKSDFNLIQSGIYRKQNNRIDFNDKTFWLPTNLVNKIKIKSKNHKADFSNLAISLQEFLNKDIIDEMEFDLDLDIISKLKNTQDDIYIICSKQTRRNYQSLIDKLHNKLKEQGILIKNFYYISENFYNQNNDDIKFKKMRLILQHLTGYKTEGDKFIDVEILKYVRAYYYDNNYDTLKIAEDINDLLGILLSKTERGLSDVIKEDIKDFRPTLFVNKINDNQYNKVETKKTILSLNKLIKTFESFKKITNKRKYI